MKNCSLPPKIHNGCAKQPKTKGCARTPELPPNATLRAMVENYKEYYQCSLNQKLNEFAKLKFDKALGLATSGMEVNESRNKHLFSGISESARNEGYLKLREKRSQLKGSHTFDQLFREVDRIIYTVKGIDEMFVFDVALRLGANKGLWPERVYLHCGAREGAKNLGLDVKNRTIEWSDLPSELHCLNAYECEDFLCIFKNHLKKVAR